MINDSKSPIEKLRVLGEGRNISNGPYTSRPSLNSPEDAMMFFKHNK
jgi:hypothetical protein